MEEGTGRPTRPEELPCERCGTVVRAWSLTPGKQGEAICPACSGKEAGRHRTRLLIGISVAVALVVVGALLFARYARYLDGPVPDMRELSEAVREDRKDDIERYCDKGVMAASFEPLIETYGEADVFQARIIANMALANIAVTEVADARATAVGHYSAANLDVTASLYEVRYDVAEVSEGAWAVVAVTNPEEIVSDLIEWNKQFGR